MKHLCQVSPAAGAPIDPPYLPWSIYAYDPNGIAQKSLVGRNMNVTGYPFPEGTQTVSYLLFFLLLFLHPSTLVLTFSSSNSAYFAGA